MRGFITGIVFTLVVIAVAIVCVSYFGLYPIGADNPPGKLEKALAMRALDEYADRNKPDMENPIEPTAANLTQGAQLYETHCALCHGGAKSRISPMQRKFNPPVPQLIAGIPADEDAWLFWVTKHGARMTAMPSWDGILSDDQIWTVVAFIKHSDKLPPQVEAAWKQAADR
jgi:mono/diheme cytochrome c family protein